MLCQTAVSESRSLRRVFALAFVAMAVMLVGASGASAVSVTGVTFTPSTNVSATPSAVWTVGFTPSATGALVQGNAVAVTFPSGFNVSGAVAGVGSGFVNCAAPTTTVSGQVVLVQLAGAGCSLAALTPAQVTITGISADFAQYSRFGFSVSTYADNTFTTPIDGSGANPPTFIHITASLTYSANTSAGTSTGSGTAPVDASSPYTAAAPGATVLANTGALTLAGHAFVGWCTTNNAADPTLCTGTQYAPGAPLTLTVNTVLYSVWAVAYAADGSGSLTLPATSVEPGSTGHTLTFTYTAATGGMNSGAVHVEVPAGWSAPSAAAGVGCTTSSSGTLAFAGQTIQVTDVTLAAGGTLTITYGATSGGACTTGNGATAQPAAGAATFQATQKSTTAGTLTPLTASPSVTVTSPPPVCTPGSYLVGSACVPADPGSFVDMAGATSQTPCPAGTFSAAAGATQCTPAPAGSYVAATGSTGALACAADTFSASTGAITCTPCPTGTTTAGATGATACAALPVSNPCTPLFLPQGVTCTPRSAATAAREKAAGCLAATDTGGVFIEGNSNGFLTQTTEHDDCISVGRVDFGSRIAAGPGNDSISVANGNNGPIFGGDGDDSISVAGDSPGEISGGAGNDSILVANSRGAISGDAGNDSISVGSLASLTSISGGAGDDSISVGRLGTYASIYGGAGNDSISVANGNGGFIIGGDGDDKVTINGNTRTESMEQQLSKALHATVGVKKVTVRLGAGNDRYDSNGAQVDVVFGGAGNDRISAGPGNDTVDGGAGADILNGEAGNDTLRGGVGNDRVFGGAGSDAVRGGAGQDFVDGGPGRDPVVDPR